MNGILGEKTKRGKYMIPFVKELTELELYDKTTYEHSIRVSRYAHSIGKEWGLDENLLDLAGLLHDIGKLFVPKTILSKPGRLTAEEKHIMDQHAFLGYKYLEDKGVDEKIRLLVLYHHDLINALLDLPEELKEYSGILSTCDIYDALTSKRPYRDAFSSVDAYKIMESEKNVSHKVLIMLESRRKEYAV